ncbi:response regulator transcription factor [Clostridium carnis]
MSKEKIKVMVIDDHHLIREGLNRIISFEEDLILLAEGKTGQDAVELVDWNEPDVILLDINMPVLSGLEALKILKEKYKNLKIVMLTVEDDRKTIKEAIDLGADAYILKESAGCEVVYAIRSVFYGDKYIDKALVKIMVTDITESNEREENILDSLTKRELRILYEISNGLKNKEIAEKLFLSEKTIKNYVTNIFRKISVEDRVQATILAIKNNIEKYFN